MKFEEALLELRKGKKIRSPYFEEDEYLMGCYVTLNFLEKEESLEEIKSRGMSIVKMKGDRQHDDMVPESLKRKELFYKSPCGRDDLHKYPQLNLFLIMNEDWDIIE